MVVSDVVLADFQDDAYWEKMEQDTHSGDLRRNSQPAAEEEKSEEEVLVPSSDEEKDDDTQVMKLANYGARVLLG